MNIMTWLKGGKDGTKTKIESREKQNKIHNFVNETIGLYAVIDIETTGLSPKHHHRILEIGIVFVDENGNQVDEWETLINPQRDVGAIDIHGITASELYDAPTFSQIAPELASLLRGRIPVAHNLSFDSAFISSEFFKAGYPIEFGRTAGLCTMRLASRYLPSGPRTLEACCECIGWFNESSHAALSDARASSMLLAHYIQSDNDFGDSWKEEIFEAGKITWPSIPAVDFQPVTRKSAAKATEKHFLGRLASRTPRNEVHPEANSYLTLLDQVLLDRQVTRYEQDELVAAAEMLGISQQDAIEIHRLYLNNLGKLAMSDGIVTKEERNDLEIVASALGLSQKDIDISLKPFEKFVAGECPINVFHLVKGDRVVFTGEAVGIERSELEAQAQSLGIKVTGGVSSKTKLLVAADPNSLSGKAKKARELNIPIVDYDCYFKMLKS